jgi:hypothetical protein
MSGEAGGHVQRTLRVHRTDGLFSEQSFDLCREHGCDNKLAVVLEGLGDIAGAQGDSAQAARLYQRSLPLRVYLKIAASSEVRRTLQVQRTWCEE